MNEQQAGESKLPSAGVTSQTERADAEASRDRRDRQSELRDTAERTKQATGEIGNDLSAKASEVADRAREHGRNFLDQQKQRVASEISACSEAARRAADRLESESDTNLSSYVSSAADHLDRLGNRIREQSVAGLVDDVEEIARHRPEVFYGGLFVAGLAAARFLKASKRQRQRDRAQVRGSHRSGDEAGPTRFGDRSARDDGGTAKPLATGAGPLPSADNAWASEAGLSSTSNEGSTGGNI